MFEQKVVDLIVGKANVSDKTVTKDELQAMVQDEDEVAGDDHDCRAREISQHSSCPRQARM